jgi:hypothetical protein
MAVTLTGYEFHGFFRAQLFVVIHVGRVHGPTQRCTKNCRWEKPSFQTLLLFSCLKNAFYRRRATKSGVFSGSGLYADVSAPNPINRPVTAADKECLIDSNESHRLLRKSVDDCDEFYFFWTCPSGLQHPLMKRHFFSIYEIGFTVTYPTRSIRGVTLPKDISFLFFLPDLSVSYGTSLRTLSSSVWQQDVLEDKYVQFFATAELRYGYRNLSSRQTGFLLGKNLYPIHDTVLEFRWSCFLLVSIGDINCLSDYKTFQSSCSKGLAEDGSLSTTQTSLPPHRRSSCRHENRWLRQLYICVLFFPWHSTPG